MSDPSLRGQVVSALRWVTLVKLLAQLVNWTITIVVVRFITPDDYGLKALSDVLFSLLMVLSTGGLGAAIIQNSQLSIDLVRKLLGVLILVNGFFFGVQYYTADLVAAYYGEPRVAPLIRTLSIAFLLVPFITIPSALLSREFEFKKKSICDLVSNTIGAILTLWMAWSGYGVWSLVIGQLLTSVLLLIGYNLVAHTRVLPSFNFSGIGPAFTLGATVSGSTILWYVYTKADLFIAGRVLDAQTIGIYALALHLATLPIDKILPLLNQVAFPAFAKIQDSPALLKSHFLKSFRLTSIVLIPIFVGLACVAEPFIRVVLGDQWLEAAGFLVLLCLVFPLRALGALFPPVLNATGHAKIPLQNTMLGIAILVPGFLVGIQWGIFGLCMAWVICIPFYTAISVSRALVPLAIPFSALLYESRSALISSLLMALVTYLSSVLLAQQLTDIALLLVLIGIGGLTYGLSMLLLFPRQVAEVKDLIFSR